MTFVPAWNVWKRKSGYRNNMKSQKAMPAGPLRQSSSEASRQGFGTILAILIALAVVGGVAKIREL